MRHVNCCNLEHRMNDQIYANMILRRRFCKRVLLMASVFAVSFYLSVLIFGDLKVPKVMHLTDLSRCPACYGISVCPELYSNQIIAETGRHWHSMLFNAKNIYHGYTKTNRKVVFKKLAHDSEFKTFDENLCNSWNLKRNCKPVDLLTNFNESVVRDKIVKLVQFNLTWQDSEPRHCLIFCPYVHGLFDFLKPVLDSNKASNKYKSDLINVWTMLNLNPEPIILQSTPKSHGWPVPGYGGLCGRLEVVTNEGEPLNSLLQVNWLRRLVIAKKIIDAAMDFTFKHDRFRFYLMDWSKDNIVVNDRDEVAFVDLEDVIVLDKHISPGKELQNWYKRYSRDDPDPGFTFSIDNICKHHLSDHNLWGACYVLAGDDDPLLYPMKNYFEPHLHDMLKECLNGADRFKAATLLQHFMLDLLTNKYQVELHR